MQSIRLVVNGKQRTVEAEPEMPLLWVLRDKLQLTGTKYGCGIAMCGACTVHVDGHPARACVTPISSVQGKSVLTIEGLSADVTHPVQQAWIEEDVPQCGYCQSGQIMAAASLLTKTAHPSEADINEALHGNICRCGTYNQIRRALHRAAEIKANGGRA
jgi:aerobic-type carbon monoxide dehydrogenase small subunit (CoxS/CutS family)